MCHSEFISESILFLILFVILISAAVYPDFYRDGNDKKIYKKRLVVRQAFV